ncbi:MAG: hypothetical protein AAF500_18555 [Myxococcota bacterium]
MGSGRGLVFVVLLCAAVAAAGCGDSDDNGGTGGTGGGTGGTGGSAATGGSGGGTGGDGGSGGAPASASIVFVTEAVQNGALGGVQVANRLCQMEADLAELDGTFLVWLSTTDSAVGDRFSQLTGPFTRVDGTLIANDLADLLDGTIEAPINLDANGVQRGGDVWTGTLATGESFMGGDCEGFQEGVSGVAQCGSTAGTDATWTENATPSCSTALRLFCFQQ